MGLFEDVGSVAGNVIHAVFGDGPKTYAGPQLGDFVGSKVAIYKAGGGDDAAFFFSYFEVPSELDFAIEQMSATHQFLGGNKTVDTFGSVSEPIEFTGELFNLPFDASDTGKMRAGMTPADDFASGETAMDRGQRLATLCQVGEEVIFQYHMLKFNASILNFKLKAHHLGHLTYTIKLEVLYDNFTKLDPGGNTASSRRDIPTPYEGLLSKFIKAAQAATDLLHNITLITETITAVVAALETDPGGFLLMGAQVLPGGADLRDMLTQGTAALAAFDNFQQVIWPKVALDFANAQPYNTLAPAGFDALHTDIEVAKEVLIPMRNVLDFYPSLTPAPGSSHAPPDPQVILALLAMYTDFYMTLCQMSFVIDQIKEPPRSISRVYLNPNFSKIALEQYGDANRAAELAVANGYLPSQLSVTGAVTVKIPSLDQIASSGATLTPSPNKGV